MSMRIFRALIGALAVCAISAQAAAASGPKPGRYECYQTIRDVSPINGEVSYSTIFQTALILHGRGRYELGLRSGVGRYAHSRSGRLAFRGGPLDSNSQFWHVGGHYYGGGRQMPYSTLNPGRRYKIVLHELRSNDSDTAPPFQEFDNRQDATFWYCVR
jgi:hypothetical protein